MCGLRRVAKDKIPITNNFRTFYFVRHDDRDQGTSSTRGRGKAGGLSREPARAHPVKHLFCEVHLQNVLNSHTLSPPQALLLRWCIVHGIASHGRPCRPQLAPRSGLRRVARGGSSILLLLLVRSGLSRLVEIRCVLTVVVLILDRVEAELSQGLPAVIGWQSAKLKRPGRVSLGGACHFGNSRSI